MNKPSHAIAERLQQKLKDPAQQQRWKKEPLALLQEVGFPLEELDEDKRKRLSAHVTSVGSGINWKCTWCETWVFTAIVTTQNVVILSIIAALVVILGGSEGADEAAVAAAAVLDEEGVINVAGELADLEVSGFDLAADFFDLPGEAFARACVAAFRAAAQLVEDHILVSFVFETVIMQFDGSLTSQICIARGDCSG